MMISIPFVKYLIIFSPNSSQDGADVPMFDMPQFGQEGAEEAEAAQQQVLDDQRAQYFGQVSEHLKPKIATKFWA
jgi:hypothetical protein